MMIGSINDAVKEAQRFIAAARQAKVRIGREHSAQYGCKETAACRRASLDLSRALTELRRPS